jgi:hypothetical protein
VNEALSCPTSELSKVARDTCMVMQAATSGLMKKEYVLSQFMKQWARTHLKRMFLNCQKF